jgi:hypothetical membrane protein
MLFSFFLTVHPFSSLRHITLLVLAFFNHLAPDHKKYIEKVKNILIISIIVALLIGLWSDVTNVLALSRTIVFFPFFIAGYQFSADKLNNMIGSRTPKEYGKSILCWSSHFFCQA